MADVGLNDVKLLGRLVRDPELQTGASGKHFCKFTVAVNRETGDQADFIKCVTFNDTAKNLAQYMSKGSQILVDGSIQTGSYTNKEGVKVYTTDVLVKRIKYLERSQSNQKSSYQQQPQTTYQAPYTPPSTATHDFGGNDDGPVLDIESDDLPF